MIPPTNTTATSGAAVGDGFRHWNTPVPYLFGGLALILAVIATALVILGCSYRKAPPNEAEEGKRSHIQLQMEPEIVVIMAGHELPSYLARPVGPVSSTHHTDQF